MEIADFQKLIRETYFHSDEKRGAPGNFLWFAEEVGELAEAIRHGTKKELEEEFADVLAWLMSLANLKDIDMEKAIDKYRNGCPVCSAIPCTCKNGS